MADFDTTADGDAISAAIDCLGTTLGELTETLRDPDMTPHLRDRFAAAALTGLLDREQRATKALHLVAEALGRPA